MHSECLEKTHLWAEGEKKIMSAVLMLLSDPSLEKKEETKKHIGFAWKNAALVGEEEEGLGGGAAVPVPLTSADLWATHST